MLVRLIDIMVALLPHPVLTPTHNLAMTLEIIIGRLTETNAGGPGIGWSWPSALKRLK